MASWQIADGIYGRVSEQEEREIEEHLSERLISVFGKLSVETGEKIQGSSLNEWEVSAIVKTPQRVAVFHAVSNHMNAIFKTSTAFHDLAGLEKPPALVSVVKSKPALGKKLGLLSQAGHVIEDGQPDEAYQRAAA
jgi:hypothetical protein